MSILQPLKSFFINRFVARAYAQLNIFDVSPYLINSSSSGNVSIINFDQSKFFEINQCIHELPSLSPVFTDSFSIPHQSVAVLPSVELIGKYSTVWCNDKYVLESCLNDLGYLTTKNDIKALVLRAFYPISSRLHRATSLVNCLTHNYCHFVLDVLPSLQFLFDENSRYDSSVRLLIHSKSPSFVFQWLSLLGIPSSSLVEISGPRVAVNQYLLPAPHYARALTSQFGFSLSLYSPSALRFLRSKALAHPALIDLTDQVNLQRRKIFINRKSPCFRRIINLDEVASLIYSFGYEEFFLDDMSVLEQLALFRSASHVLAIHGAGLANLIVAQSCCLIELYPSSKSDGLLYFLQLSNLFCSKHIRLICPDNSLQDIYVDTSLLNALLESA